MDAIANYQGTVELYALDFAQNAERDAENAGDMVDAWILALEQHEKTRPARGAPSKEWVEEKERLAHTLAGSRQQLDHAMEVMTGGESHPEAIKYARKVVEKHHPEVVEAYQAALEALPPPPDSLEIYNTMVDEYKKIFMDKVERDYQSYAELTDAWAGCLNAHQYTKPDIVENIVTLGKAGQSWNSEHSEIEDKVDHCQNELKAAWDILDTGPSHPDAVKYAEESVRDNHPDIDRNFRKTVDLQKQIEQAHFQRELKEKMASILSQSREPQTAEHSR